MRHRNETILNMKNKNNDDWAALFMQAIKSKEKKPIGNGWRTADELAEDMNTSRISVKRRLTGMIAAKQVEKFNGSKMTAEGLVCNMTWYRIKKGAK